MRPVHTFHGFVGQAQIVAALEEQIAGARRDGSPLPHAFFTGSSGTGKTCLARAVAKAMGTGLHEVSCTDRTTRVQLAEVLAEVNTADCLYLDEVHALAAPVQELLYPAVDSWKVPVVREGRIVENEWRDIPPFTLILSTDQPGGIRNGLRRRVPLQFHLRPYNDREMREVVRNRAAELEILLSNQAVTRLAQASRGLPRTARQRLECLRTAVGRSEGRAVTKSEVEHHLRLHGIDSDNLTRDDRAYLALLARNGDAPLSSETLSLGLGLDERTLRREIESYLLARGWLSIGSRGRRLTPEGLDYVRSRGLPHEA